MKKKLFLDEQRNVVPKEKARFCVTHEYDANGKLKAEHWVDLKK